MPIYEFRCKKCKKVFESLILSPKEEKNVTCPKCGLKTTDKVMSVFADGKANCSSCASTSSSPS